ncbi:MAG: hypothetical protein AAGG08_15375, partial [Actinomycetota bacterium]
LGVVNAANGELVPGLEPWLRVDTRVQFNYLQAVMALDDEVWQVGSQHVRQVYRADDHRLIRNWISQPRGDGQAVTELNGIVYTGSHAVAGQGRPTWLYRDATTYPSLDGWTDRQPVRYMAAFDNSVDQQIPWVPQIGAARGEGSWALYADSTDCLWSGGDINRGSFDGDTPRFASGFVKFCAADRTPPAPPEDPTATNVGGGVNLAWQQSSGDDRDGDDIFYELLKNGEIFASYISITTFRDPDGTPDDRYFVRAMDRTGNRSATTQVFTANDGPDTTRPTTPQSLGAAIDPADLDDVELVWDASSDNVAVTEYQVLRNGVEIGRSAAATFRVVDAPEGDSWFQVRALDAAGNQSFKTPPVKVTVDLPDVDSAPPTTPRDLAGQVDGAGDISLTWTAATDDVGVAEYVVFRNNQVVGTTADAAFVFTEPPVGDNWMQIRAIDAAGNESFKTPPLRITVSSDPVADTTPPTTPRDLVGSQVDADVALEWAPSTDDVAVTEYLVLRNGDLIGRTGEPAFVVVDATIGTNWYQVRAVDAAGNESFKTPPLRLEVSEQPGVDATPPRTPQNLSGTIDVGTSVTTLRWDASTDDVGVATYVVLRNGERVGAVDGTTLTTEAPAEPGGNWYQIQAVDNSGNESFRTPPLRLDL